MKEKTVKPPFFTSFFLKLITKRRDEFSLLGDFDEEFEEIAEIQGIKSARSWYRKHLLKSLPVIFRDSILWSFDMFKNYFKIAFRNFKKNKFYTFINVFGLSVGMTCCVITLVFMDTMLFDRSHEKSENLYRIITEREVKGNIYRGTSTPYPLANVLKNEIAEIENTTRIMRKGKTVIQFEENRFYEHGVFFTDPSIFDLFTVNVISGDLKTALSEPGNIVITESIAQKYFGNSDPVGRIVNFDNKSALTVKAVIENISKNSTIRFDILIPLEYYLSNENKFRWDVYNFETFVLLRNNAGFQDVNNSLIEWIKTHTDEKVTYYLQSFEDIKLQGVAGEGEIYVLYVFTGIAILVLIIGCLNFMNLSTAKAGARALEIGMRKVIGASKKDIIKQCLGETLIMAFFGLMIALVLTKLALPYLSNAGNREFSLNLLNSFPLLSGLFLVTLFTGLLAGSYPAFYLSSFQPDRVIRGSSKKGSRFFLRRFLAISQFTFSIVFIIFTVFLHRQFKYLKTMPMGFDKENLMVIDMKGDINKRFEAFKNDLLQNPQIIDVTAANNYPYGPIGVYMDGVEWDGKDPDEDFRLYSYSADKNFIETFGLKIIEGKSFLQEERRVSSNFIINEDFAKKLGFDNTLGKSMRLKDKTGTIIGVIKDFNFRVIVYEI